SHQVKVKATDAGGEVVEKTFTIDVIDEVDVFVGTKGKNKLVGTDGDDIIKGGLGNDTLTGKGGKDAFVFNTKPNKKKNLDTIKDFKSKDDSIWLDNKIFKKLGKKGSEDAPAKLNKKFFKVGSKAKDKND